MRLDFRDWPRSTGGLTKDLNPMDYYREMERHQMRTLVVYAHPLAFAPRW